MQSLVLPFPTDHKGRGKSRCWHSLLTAQILGFAAAANSCQLPHLASLHRAKDGISSKPGTSQNVHLADNSLPCSEPKVTEDVVPKWRHKAV